jgi:hypothetical protein
VIRHSEARKTYRLRRYMTAQVSWMLGKMITERKDADEGDPFLGGVTRTIRT